MKSIACSWMSSFCIGLASVTQLIACAPQEDSIDSVEPQPTASSLSSAPTPPLSSSPIIVPPSSSVIISTPTPTPATFPSSTSQPRPLPALTLTTLWEGQSHVSRRLERLEAQGVYLALAPIRLPAKVADAMHFEFEIPKASSQGETRKWIPTLTGAQSPCPLRVQGVTTVSVDVDLERVSLDVIGLGCIPVSNWDQELTFVFDAVSEEQIQKSVMRIQLQLIVEGLPTPQVLLSWDGTPGSILNMQTRDRCDHFQSKENVPLPFLVPDPLYLRLDIPKQWAESGVQVSGPSLDSIDGRKWELDIVEQKFEARTTGAGHLTMKLSGLSQVSPPSSEMHLNLTLPILDANQKTLTEYSIPLIIAPVLLRSFDLSWIAEGNSVEQTLTRILQLTNKSDLTFEPSVGFTLPASPPDALNLRFKVPASFAAARSIQVKAEALTSESPQTFQLATNDTRIQPGPTTSEYWVSTTITGIRSLLATSIEQRIWLRTEIRDGLILIAQMKVPLSTPPSLLVSQQTPVSKFKEQGGRLPPGTEVMSTQANDLTLIQVAQMTNQSSEPIEVTLQTHPKGQVFLQTRLISTKNEFGPSCGYRIVEQDLDGSLSEDLVMLPLATDLPTRFPSILRADLGRFTLLFNPGETQLIGFYLLNWHDFMTDLPDREQLSLETVYESCHYRCNSPTVDREAYRKQCSTPPISSGDAIECYSAVDTCLRCDVSHPTDCATCYLQDSWLAPGGAWRRRYHSFCLGQSSWEHVRKEKKVLSGFSTYPIFLSLSPVGQSAVLRFTRTSAAEDPETRTMPLFQARTIVIE